MFNFSFLPSNALKFCNTSMAAALLVIAGAHAQAANPTTSSAQAQCIVAGRLDASQQWAPQASGVELLDASGKRITASGKDALAAIRQVRISSPALLSACNGNQALAQGGAAAARKPSVPAISAGAAPLAVETVSFPPLRVGGDLVELRLTLAPDRVVSLTR